VAEQPQESSERRVPSVGDAEAQLGGADAVEKTTYVVGKGTDPEARSDGPSATVSSRGSPLIVIVIVGALAVLVAIAYLVGIMR
jgi:hypothetical protein